MFTPISAPPSPLELIEHLGNSATLGRLEPEVLEAIAGRCECGELTAGAVLFEYGARADCLYLVLRGELEAVLPRADEPDLVLSRIPAGSTVGEIQILTSGERTATVRARTDAQLGRLTKADVDELSSRHPELLNCLATVIGERLRRDQLVEMLPLLFGHVDEVVLQEFEAAIEWVHLARGERLFKQGDSGDSVYLNVSGRLSAVIENGLPRPRVVGQIPSGEVVGEMALFTGEPRTASVYATRDSELAKVDAPAFEGLVQRHPRILRSITSSLIDRLRNRGGSQGGQSKVRNIAIVPLSEDVPIQDFSRRLVAELSAEPTAHLSSRRVDDHLGMPNSAQLPDDSPFNLRVRSWLEQLESEHRFVVYEADDKDSPWTRRCIRQADQVLLVGLARSTPDLAPVERDFIAHENEVCAAPRRLVLLHPNGDKLPEGTASWLEPRDVEMHHHIRWSEAPDFQRLGRLLRGCAIGLVLSGGGARGMAHLGVIRALRDSGIPIDMIGGTSAGGLIGAQLAMGMSQERMYQENHEAFVRNKPFHDFNIPIVSLVGSGRMNRLAQKMYGETRLEDMWLNFFCVSCNLGTGDPVIHRDGPAWKVVRASSALPGIAVPVVDGDRYLVDGGVVDNLPGGVMKELCGGHVLAVDVSPDENLQVNFAAIPPSRTILWSWLAPHRKSISVPTIGDVIIRTAVISSVKKRQEARELSALVFTPPVSEFGLLEFRSFDKIIAAGYEYALETIAAWEKRDEICPPPSPEAENGNSETPLHG